MSVRNSIIKKEARRLGVKTRQVSRYIGRSMLNSILNDIDTLSGQTRDMVKSSEAMGRDEYANPSYIFTKYKRIFDSSLDYDNASDKEREVRNAIYTNQRVFKHLKYESNKLSGMRLSNSLLHNIFNRAVVSNIVFEASVKSYVYKIVHEKSKPAIRKIAKEVYIEREKYVTGLTIRDISIKVKPIIEDGRQVIYVEMRSDYTSPGRTKGYYNTMMDTGTFAKRDLPTLEDIYGWIKRRKAAGRWRPLILVGWRNRNPRTGGLTKKDGVDRPAKDYEAAFVIMTRLKMRFAKRGRLYPFGNFAKYMKRNTVYNTSIFTEIFRKYINMFEQVTKKRAPEIQSEVNNEFKLKLSNVIKHIKRGNKSAERAMASLNFMIKRKGLVPRIGDIPISDSYQITEIKKLVRLANNLGVVVVRK